MILLYQDPRGSKSRVNHSQTDSKAVGAAAPQVLDNKLSSELEKKVTLLEKTVHEGEKTIAELKHKIDILMKDNQVLQVCAVKLCLVYIWFIQITLITDLDVQNGNLVVSQEMNGLTAVQLEETK